MTKCKKKKKINELTSKAVGIESFENEKKYA